MSMSVNIAQTLLYLRPGEEWTLDGDTYDGLTWLSNTAKPTEAEITNAAPAAQLAADAQAAARQSGLTKLAKASGLTPDELAALGL